MDEIKGPWNVKSGSSYCSLQFSLVSGEKVTWRINRLILCAVMDLSISVDWVNVV